MRGAVTADSSAELATTERGMRYVELAVGITIAAAYLYFSAGELLAEFGGDNAVYWLVANHYSPFGAEHPLAAAYAASSAYPPLYPLVLAVLGGGTSVLAAHLVSAALLCLGFLAMHRFALELGVPRGAALVLVLLVALLPIMRFGATEMQSEDLFLPVTLAALTAMLRLGDCASPARLAWIGLLIAAAILTRTAGLALALAFAIHALVRRQPAWLFALLPAAVAWGWNSLYQHSTSRYARQLIESYLRDGPVERLAQQLYSLPVEWSRALAGAVTTWGPITFVSGFGLVLVAAAVRRSMQHQIDGHYAVIYLAMLALWPYPSEIQRIGGMIVPVLLVQAYLWAAGPARARARRSLLALAIVVLPAGSFALPDAATFASRMAMPGSPALRPFARATVWHIYEPEAALEEVGVYAAMYETMAEIERLVPAGECIYALKPSIVGLYGRRRALEMPPQMPAAAFREAAHAGGCRYFLLSTFVRRDAPLPFHPLAILGKELKPLSAHRNAFVHHGQFVAMLARWEPGG